MNVIDRAISYFAPVAGAKRINARAEIDALVNAQALYDGAARSWRTAGRNIGPASANVEILRSAEQLRNVSRDLRRNNATADNAIRVISTHVVGAGIVPAIEGATDRLKKRLSALIRSHLETTAVDFDGRHNIYGLQRLVMDTVIEAGEALIVRRVARTKVPFQIQVLEPEYLDKRMTGPTKDGNTLFEGIEVDAAGRRIAYHIYSSHPGGGLTWQLPNSTRVPAEDVLHVFRQDRPGQMRGVPWCAPIIITLRDLADYEDADLVRQKIAACFAIFLKNSSPETNLAQQSGAAATRQGTVLDRVEPGLIQKLPPGVEAQFGTPPTVAGQKDFISIKNHKIAAGYGVPYELLTMDLKEVSFISGRLGLMQFHRTVDQWRWHMLIPHFCAGVGGWFLQAAKITLQQDVSHVTLRHTPPRREMIEPSKEINAMRDAIRNGLSSRDEEVRSLGGDPEEIEKEIAEGNRRADGLGLGFDSDGRRPLAFSDQGKGGEGGTKPAAK